MVPSWRVSVTWHAPGVQDPISSTWVCTHFAVRENRMYLFCCAGYVVDYNTLDIVRMLFERMGQG